ncbi:toll/interleukin-1 receptor domain-containing protein [Stenotrophomonas sp. S39]|uniref:toll/interleukin-1 receptor domain-containing protein n=1 Tax=Stenotrophomonas sp. S39 TaxID=2767451 RepID=UPI0019092842|nr:toll/interleukin-1 receptor domain-containing protein [Stenotrophomonas sp. S39]MBK0052733.1 toll/interleukin-1 receptor domain-containing protein [Stenotrophomonas sp. S39]
MDLKTDAREYDLDSVFDSIDRQNELEAAMAAGATVVWCMAEPRRMNFFCYRKTSLGHLAPAMTAAIGLGSQVLKKRRRVGFIDPDTPFASYFDDLSSLGGWRIALESDEPGLTTIAATPEGYQLGARVEIGGTRGWLMTPPLTQEATNRLISGALSVSKAEPDAPRYHEIFLSHSSADKPFIRQLRRDLLARGMLKAWRDETEIQVGDSLIAKIDEGMAMS